MHILFLPKPGVNLFQALLASETSREALTFYRPVHTPAGVKVTMASLGSALSLSSDLRWYVRRYMRDVLFEIEDGVYCTRALAQEIYYGRAPVLHRSWKFRRIYFLKDGQVKAIFPFSREIRGDPVQVPEPEGDIRLEVWCTPAEFEGKEEAFTDEETEEESDGDTDKSVAGIGTGGEQEKEKDSG
ncbi:MAG: DUF5804 family protein [Methanolinea sp.]|nr:DUF5804 family protein [Methanolinea sp.]